MNKLSTMMKILIVLLIIVASFYIYLTFFSNPTKPVLPGDSFSIGKPPISADVKSPSRGNISSNVGGLSSDNSAPVKKFNGDWGDRDPFFREVKKQITVEQKQAEEIQNLVLSGVQWVNGGAIAVINNKIYWEGDVVEGKKIVKVEKDCVVLREGNKEFILRLGGEK